MRWSFRLWSRVLSMADGLFGTRLVEWELARRQRRIDDLVAQVDAVNQGLDALLAEMTGLRLALCLVELKARSEQEGTEDWLRFAPHEDGEELILDNAIECLVKPRLASVDVEPAGADQYIYRLRPDWEGIAAWLEDRSEDAELIAWLNKQG